MSFPYDTIQQEHIHCNLCGQDSYLVLSERGTDGLALRSCLCRHCGLIYINPRMVKDGYKLYYEHEYRDKTINHGEQTAGFSCDRLFRSTQVHGQALGRLMQPYLTVPGAIMEVGSGVGGVLFGIRSVVGRDIVGLEPSGQEARYATSQGVKTYHTLIEDHPVGERYAAIVSTQSLNHFLNPRYFFGWAYASLVDGGIIVVEVMNFRQQLSRAGHYRNSVKIDHVYMFTPEVLRDFVCSAGFDVLHVDVDEGRHRARSQGIPRMHIRIVARKSIRKPFEHLRLTPGVATATARSLRPLRMYLSYIFNVRIPRIIHDLCT